MSDPNVVSASLTNFIKEDFLQLLEHALHQVTVPHTQIDAHRDWIKHAKNYLLQSLIAVSVGISGAHHDDRSFATRDLEAIRREIKQFFEDYGRWMLGDFSDLPRIGVDVNNDNSQTGVNYAKIMNGNITDIEQAISHKWYNFSAQDQEKLLGELSKLRKHIAELSTPYVDAERNHHQRCLALGRVLLENRNYSRIQHHHNSAHHHIKPEPFLPLLAKALEEVSYFSL
ncbi:hypothetical protein JCM3766R1_006816 [Sporobolomyces carnicolor]